MFIADKVVYLLKEEEIGEVYLWFGPGPQQVPAYSQLHPMRELVPDSGAVETAVDDVVDFLFGPNYAVEHDIRVGDLVIASDAMQHALSTLMKGIELNAETICILPSFL